MVCAAEIRGTIEIDRNGTRMLELQVLHIGKTAGTALKYILEEKKKELQSAGFRARLCGHWMTLKALLDGSQASANLNVIFFVRDPISRFRSGFNSRLRKGQPRYFAPWTREEAVAFKTFSTPDQLACAISDTEMSARLAAESAMAAIRHLNNHYSHWLISTEYLEKHASNLFYIGLQETFDEDAGRLLEKLGVSRDLPILDEKVRHATPSTFETSLSQTGIDNLRQWYEDDYRIYDWCAANRGRINGSVR
jgi:hypothetical protein